MAASKKFRSKFFRVAVEGATTDGRNIERQWLVDAAETYNPNTYGARVWLEHFRSVLPDGPFKAYGDVVALKTEEVDVAGKTKLALFAQIEPTSDLIALNKARKKIYTSIEISPKFADSGRAYLDGIAVTDSPASLGTEMLAFSAQHPDANPLKTRKNAPDNLFSEAIEVEFEFEEVTDSESKVANLFSRVMEALGKSKDKAVKDDIHGNGGADQAGPYHGQIPFHGQPPLFLSPALQVTGEARIVKHHATVRETLATRLWRRLYDLRIDRDPQFRPAVAPDAAADTACA